MRAVGPEGGGGWRIDPAQSAWDLETLEQGTWGGGVVDGPQEDHSTFRGEAFGLLAVLVWLYCTLPLRVAGQVGSWLSNTP